MKVTLHTPETIYAPATCRAGSCWRPPPGW
jgi:hypothetical protein